MTTPIFILASGGSIIDLDATVFIQLVIFLFMFVFLRQFLFRPVIKIIEARREATDGMRAAAEEFDEEARKLNDDLDKQILDIRSSASEERHRMVEQARRQERDVLIKSREDSRGVVEQAKKEASEQSDEAWRALREEVNTFASTVATRVLGRQV
ncbi:MAG: ATP synthase F0 subunit B [Proteobacteria bacterium]|nr:ATP synthase F0 subunit B [Pseudomonadota bacterium]